MVSTHALQGSVDGLAVDSTNSCRLFLAIISRRPPSPDTLSSRESIPSTGYVLQIELSLHISYLLLIGCGRRGTGLSLGYAELWSALLMIPHPRDSCFHRGYTAPSWMRSRNNATEALPSGNPVSKLRCRSSLDTGTWEILNATIAKSCTYPRPSYLRAETC